MFKKYFHLLSLSKNKGKLTEETMKLSVDKALSNAPSKSIEKDEVCYAVIRDYKVCL